jgi:hypothetical protein
MKTFIIIIMSLLTLFPCIVFANEADNIALIKKYYEAYGTGDAEKVAVFFADDIIWRIPGHHPLSGEKHGKEEVTAFFAELAKANFKAEPIFFGADGDFVVDVHRGWSNVEGYPNVDTMWTLVFRIKDGKIAEVTNLCADQHAADTFFWSFYKLAPIPKRLK